MNYLKEKQEIKITPGKAMIFGISAILFIFAIVICTRTPKIDSTASDTSKSYTGKTVSELQQSINEAMKLGFLKKIEAGHNYYVDFTIWSLSNIDTKKGWTMIFADYSKTANEQNWCEVYDYMSGKKIAKLNTWGFEVY
jgi:hypothetical protein